MDKWAFFEFFTPSDVRGSVDSVRYRTVTVRERFLPRAAKACEDAGYVALATAELLRGEPIRGQPTNARKAPE